MTAKWPRTIAHADMDAFYAAVEQLDDPALRGRPVLVGPKSSRGVVLTASYEARPAGVGSAMPMALARRRCPEAIVVPPRFERYREISRLVMAVFADFSPEVEPLSLDEAFLDMTGSRRVLGEPPDWAPRLKRAIREATGGLTASVGVSGTKYVAKVASGCAKPDGLTIVPPGEAQAWLAPQSVAALWGAGPKLQARLAQLGMATIGDVAAAPAETLVTAFGSVGLHLQALARGDDPRPVVSARAPKSLSAEQTLETDVVSPDEIRFHLRQAAERVGRRLRRQAYMARGVRIKLKRTDFTLVSRQTAVAEPTQSAARLYEAAVSLLAHLDDRGPFRLVGLGAFDIVPAETSMQLDLLTSTGFRTSKLEAVLDQVEARFGPGAVHRAREAMRPGVLGTDGTSLDFLSEPGSEDSR